MQNEPVRPRQVQVYQPETAAEARIFADELGYANLVKEIIETGVYRCDRTQVGTWSVFGRMLRYDLSDGKIPLLTQKQVPWRAVVEELLWFMRGSTDANELDAKGVKIWNANGAKTGGDLGPIYGFQWRHFGATYVDCKTDYRGKGIDQLALAINALKTNPNSRQIVISAWNPVDLPEMVLPPCHMSMQFDVTVGADGPRLSCMMTQRSADMGLGVPFNMASYALLVHIIAKVCGMKPGELVHSIGNAHVYANHVDPLCVQLSRQPRPMPRVDLSGWNVDVDPMAAIEALKPEHIKLVGYNPHPPVKMEMAL